VLGAAVPEDKDVQELIEQKYSLIGPGPCIVSGGAKGRRQGEPRYAYRHYVNRPRCAENG
jgi:hypothetical protein